MRFELDKIGSMPQALQHLFNAVKRVIYRLVIPKELREIKEQMDFWHAETRKLMAKSFEAYDKGDEEEYKEKWAQYLNAQRRCDIEVTNRLASYRNRS